MKPRLSLSLALFCLCLLALPALAAARDSGGGPGDTQLTIAETPIGVYGKLDAPNPDCAAGRGVTVYRMTGDHRDPESDRRVGLGTARRVGDADDAIYMWTARTVIGGTLYAVADPRDGCAEADSDRLDVTANSGRMTGTSDCPTHVTAEMGPICSIDLHLKLDPCQFTAPQGGAGAFPCAGTSEGSPAWAVPTFDFQAATYANLYWVDMTEDYRKVAYQRVVGEKTVASIVGRMDRPGTKTFTVTRAAASPSDPMYLVSSGTREPGTIEGPLAVSVTNGKGSADIFIHGYLWVTP